VDVPSTVSLCIQCRKCTAGCAVADATDLPIADLMGWLRTGDVERAFRSNALWECTGCHACSTRCPSGADPAAVLDELRAVALALGIAPEPRAGTFNRAFLKSVRNKGRSDEARLMMTFYLRHGWRKGDIATAWALLRRGRVKMWGRKIRARKDLQRIFALAGGAKEKP
jgi:heterodisulfide reductase subunit C2